MLETNSTIIPQQFFCLMVFKHHIGDVPKLISDLFQTDNNYHSYGTRCSQSHKLQYVEVIYQTFTHIR